MKLERWFVVAAIIIHKALGSDLYEIVYEVLMKDGIKRIVNGLDK